MPTKTQLAKSAMDEAITALTANYRLVMRQEFQRGAKVKYLHGSHWIEGTVEDVAPFEWSDEIAVRNTKSGIVRNVDAHKVEFAN